MITLSPLIAQLLQQPAVSTFFLMKTSTGLRKTTYPNDVVFQGENYESDGSVISIELPKMTSVVDKQKFRITLADNSLNFAAAAEQALVGQTVSVWMSVLDSAGLPVLTPADVILIYKGAVDAPSHQMNLEASGSMLFNLDCASPMADLDRTRTYFASQDYIDKTAPGDTSYEQIFQGSGPVSLRWGKS